MTCHTQAPKDAGGFHGDRWTVMHTFRRRLQTYISRWPILASTLKPGKHVETYLSIFNQPANSCTYSLYLALWVASTNNQLRARCNSPSQGQRQPPLLCLGALAKSRFRSDDGFPAGKFEGAAPIHQAGQEQARTYQGLEAAMSRSR